MGVPIVYRKGSAQPLTTYDFFDISSGTGYVKLYGGFLISGANLSNFTYYANPYTMGKQTTATGGFVKIHDLDFDVLLNKPVTYRGNAIINVTDIVSNSGSGGSQGYIHVRIRKWDGTTETEIANQSGSMIVTGPGASGNIINAFLIPIPLTNFKKGETLRLTIEGWAQSSVGGAGDPTTMNIFFDPMNRDVTGITGTPTTLILEMPVRINL